MKKLREKMAPRDENRNIAAQEHSTRRPVCSFMTLREQYIPFVKKALEVLDNQSVTCARREESPKQQAHLFMDVVRESKPVPSDCDNWESSEGLGRTHPLDLLEASMGRGCDAVVFLLIMVGSPRS